MQIKVELVNNQLVPRYFRIMENAIDYAAEAAYIFQTQARMFVRESTEREWVHYIPKVVRAGGLFV